MTLDRPRQQASRRGFAVAVYALLAVGLVGVVAVPDQASNIGPIVVLIGFLATAVTLTHKSRALVGKDRVAWMTIGVGFAIAALGMLSFGVLEVVAGPLPAFSPLDILFVAAYCVILFGFSIIPHQTKRPGERIRTHLDGLIGAVAVSLVAWALFLDEMLRGFSDATGWERWVGPAYPILDIAALIVLVLLGFRRTALRFDPRLMWFGAGLVAQVVADVLFLRRGIGVSFEEAQPYFPAFIVASACYFTAARLLDHRFKHREYAAQSTTGWSMVGPYLAAAVTVAVVGLRVVSTDLPADTRTALRMILVMVTLVIVRQALAIRENTRAVGRQRAQLVASVSHELRTPLTAVVGYLDLLDSGDDLEPEERAEITAIAGQQARYMAALVSDLVDMGREGRTRIEPLDGIEDVAALVASSVQSVEVGEVSVSCEIEPGLVASVDARRIQQVIVNLLSNAVRYGDDRILVRATSEGHALVIEVHDNGPGVPRRWELAIWDRFERGSHRFSARHGGTGLGLAVVADIAAAYRGSAEYARSERLGGAHFRVLLPNRVVDRTEPLAEVS